VCTCCLMVYLVSIYLNLFSYLSVCLSIYLSTHIYIYLREGRKVFGFIKKTTSYTIEKMYLHYIFPPPPGGPHAYDFLVLNSLAHPRKIMLVLLQIGKWEIGKPKTYQHPYPSLYLPALLLLDLGRLFSFLILYTVGRTPWTGDQPVGRPLPTHKTT
jgi:hypothetical protein